MVINNMPEMDIETNDSTNVEETPVVTDETTPQLTVDDYNRLLEEKEKLEKTNKQLYARLKKPSESLQTAEPSNRIDDLELKLELRDRGIPLEHLPFIKQNGGIKALDNPIVKAGLESAITQAKAEQAISGDSASKSAIERKFTLEQLKSMSLDELEKTLRQS